MIANVFFTILLSLCAAFVPIVVAKQVVVTVGSTSNDPSKVFTPSTVTAKNGDVVFFNFTQGNHTVTQSTFAFPCVRIHDYDVTKNGFDSSFRDAGNAQAVTNLQVTVTNASETIWFFDWNTCAQGGVGAIDIQADSGETYDGFVRNAIRLNGTAASSSSASGSGTPTATSHSSQTSTNAASRHSTGPLLLFAGLLFMVALAA